MTPLQVSLSAHKAVGMPMPALPPDLSRFSLAEIEKLVAEKKMPPVETWNPPYCGHSHMRIARDGRWFHEGGLISRETMVRLFASILRREADGSYCLVTPAERVTIDVDDAPFVAVEVKSSGHGKDRQLAFRLKSGDLVVAGTGHPLRFAVRDGEPSPYVMVRGGMEALIARSVFYELADMALGEAGEPLGLWSDSCFFAMDMLL
jgi:uncharacterized protein